MEIIPLKNPENKQIECSMSNTAIKIIKSALNEHQGDKDDPNYQTKLEQVRNDVHEVWRLLNPS